MKKNIENVIKNFKGVYMLNAKKGTDYITVRIGIDSYKVQSRFNNIIKSKVFDDLSKAIEYFVETTSFEITMFNIKVSRFDGIHKVYNTLNYYCKNKI